MSKAIVLLSGGLDSATALAIAKAEGFKPCAITFRYGQRHQTEIEAAKRQAKDQGVEQHLIMDIDLRMIGGSSLTTDTEVPRNRSFSEMNSGIPNTYVPARNTIFLSFALAWSEVVGADDIYIGVNSMDYAGYPDCRPEYIEAYGRLANVATRSSTSQSREVRIHAPLIALSKSQIIQRGIDLGVDFSLTSSCYSPDNTGLACGTCDACRLRLWGFEENSFADPIGYALVDGEHQ